MMRRFAQPCSSRVVPTLRRDLSKPLRNLSLCFDLDGTLIETAPDLVRVTNEMIATRGHGPTSYKRARSNVGYGSRRMLTDALDEVGDTIGKDALDALQAGFLTRYAETIDALSTPFPGVEQTLQELLGLGAHLSVCTNKPGWLARPLLEKLELTPYFERIVGGDEAPRAKPDPRHIYKAAGHRDTSRIVMVGDSWPDMRAAQNAGVYAVLMTYGYTPVDHKRLRADTRLSRFRDLMPTLLALYQD